MFRALLRVYPREFRERFGADLEADFLDLRAAHGVREAWRRTLADLARSVPLTHSTAQRERERLARVTGGLPGSGQPMHNIATDIKLAIRTFRKSPAFSAAATLTLALGIGVNVAVYSLLHAALIETLPVRDPDRVVQVFTSSSAGDHFSFSYPLYVDIRERATSLEGVAAYLTSGVGFSTGDRSERLTAEFVTSNFFPLLGVGMRMGPGLTGADELRGGPQSVVISHALWLDLFGGDAGVVGRAVSINGQTFTIAGVASPGFAGIVRGQRAHLWLSVSQFFPLRNRPDLLDARESSWLGLIGRLAAGVTDVQAQEQLTAVVRQLPGGRDADTTYVARVRQASAGDPGLVEQLETPLRLLMATVGLILLIACANVANLLLARSSSRQREIAVRQALGASRIRIAQHVIVETLIFAVAGAVVGVLLAVWTLNVFEVRAVGSATPLALASGVRMPVLLFAIGLALVTTVIVGVIPALSASNPNLADVIKRGGASIGAAPARSRIRSGLVVLQIALSFVLVFGAGLFLRSLWQLRSIDPSLATDRVVAATVSLTLRGYDAVRGQQFYERLTADIAAIPGIEAATLTSVLPVTGGGSRINLNPRSTTPPIDGPFEADIISTAPGYFETFGIPLTRGRDFTADDRASRPQVAIINETMKQRMWGDADPIGQTLAFGSRPADRFEVVGVARNTKYRNLRESPRMTIYLPLAQSYTPAVNLVIRTRIPLDSAAGAMRAKMAALDPAMPLYNLRTLGEHVERSLYLDTLRSRLIAALALLAVVLAAIGIYGLMSFAVSQRTREVGVRLALGAKRSEVLGLILGSASRLALGGIALGIVIAGWLAQSAAARVYVAGDLYGVKTTDALTIGAGALLLYGVVILASLIPALRALRVDPMTALRES